MANAEEMSGTTDLEVIFNASSVTNITVTSNASEEEIELSESAIKLGEDLKILMKIVPFLVPILFSIIIIIGFVGNLLVVFVVLMNKNMRNTTNLLILNLAVCISGLKGLNPNPEQDPFCPSYDCRILVYVHYDI